MNKPPVPGMIFLAALPGMINIEQFRSGISTILVNSRDGCFRGLELPEVSHVRS